MEPNTSSNKKVIKAWISGHLGLIFFALFAAVALAAAINFASREATISITSKTWIKMAEIPSIDNISLAPSEGKDITVEQVIKSDSTFETYRFYALTMPAIGETPVYSITPDSGWEQIDVYMDGEKSVVVYAYASSGTLTALDYEGSTSQLVERVTMIDMSNADYAGLGEDIGIDISAWEVSKDDVSGGALDVYRSVQGLGAP